MTKTMSVWRARAIVALAVILAVISGAAAAWVSVGASSQTIHAWLWNVSDPEAVNPDRTLIRAVEEDLGMTWEQYLDATGTDRDSIKVGGDTERMRMGTSLVLNAQGKDAQRTCSTAFTVPGDGPGQFVITAAHCVTGEGTPNVSRDGYSRVARVDDHSDLGISSVGTAEAELAADIFDNHGDFTAFRTRDDDVMDNTAPISPAIPGQSHIVGRLDTTIPSPGTPVCALGATSGWRCGTVLAVNDREIQASFCSAPGDSGGVILSGDRIAGVVAYRAVDYNRRPACQEDGKALATLEGNDLLMRVWGFGSGGATTANVMANLDTGAVPEFRERKKSDGGGIKSVLDTATDLKKILDLKAGK